MANTSGEKELKTRWPHESGLIAGTTKQKGRRLNLIPRGLLGRTSIVNKKYRKGL